jgi:DNA-binding PadR family transcriptional regulator
MSLKYAMLGFLNMRALSGYDLKKMFGASVQFYWPATHSQIYRTLDQMLKDDLVTQEIIHQEDYPNKKNYHITDKGKQELRDWLVTPQELPTIRHKLLVQLSWADQLENDEIIALLEAYADKVQERLALYQGQQQQLIAEYARTPREHYLWQLTLENGIGLYECEWEWVKNAIKGLTNFTEG